MNPDLRRADAVDKQGVKAMQRYEQFYIIGQWVEPVERRTLEVINPATEKPIATIALGSAADVDKVVDAYAAVLHRRRKGRVCEG